MNSLSEQLLQQLSTDDLSSLSQQIGADERSTASALGVVFPLLVSALAGNASDPIQAQQLDRALERDHDGSLLDNIGGFLNNPMAVNGAGILKHIFGDRQPELGQELSRGIGLDSNQIKRLMLIAAPLVMALLAKKRQSKNLDSGGLSDYLGRQKASIPTTGGGDLFSILNGLLDRNRNGSALDDIMGMFGKMMNRR